MPKCDNCPKTNPNLEKCQLDIMPKLEYEEIRQDLIAAIKEFYTNDIELLERNINEVCITSHVFHYFSMLHKEKYKPYNIDPEYNKNGLGAKYYDNRYAKPDLIIHKRDCNKYNLLYIEFKTNVCCHDWHDKEKIERFVSNDFGEENGRIVMPYKYKFGVSIVLNRDKVKMLWYRNGKKVPICENVFSTVTWEMM